MWRHSEGGLSKWINLMGKFFSARRKQTFLSGHRSTEFLLQKAFLVSCVCIGVGEGVAGWAAAPLVEQKFATFGPFS